MIVAAIAKLCACAVLIVPTLAANDGHDGLTYGWDTPTPSIHLAATVVPPRGRLGETIVSWYSVWVVGHELGHANWRTFDERAANCYAWTHWKQVSERVFGLYDWRYLRSYVPPELRCVR
jgi:hypothetical protein